MLPENLAACGANGGCDLAQEFFRRQSGRVGGGKQDPLGFEQKQRAGHEFTEILLRLKHAVLLRLRKGRRIERDQVELPSLLCQTPQPIENIAGNEGVGGRVQAVEREIAFAPFEIFSGKVEAGRARAGFRRADGETARISERVQKFHSRERK